MLKIKVANISFVIISLLVLVVYVFEPVRIKIYDITNSKLIESGFTAKNINISELYNVDENVILSIIEHYTKNTNILFLRLSNIEKELLKLDWVKNVNVESNFADSLQIEILEHDPKAFYQTEQSFNIIDENADVILSSDDMSEYKFNVPQLIGEGALINAQDIIEILQKNSDFYQNITYIERVGFRRWDLTLTNGIVIKLPENSVQENWNYFLSFEQEFNILNSDIKSIDLRTKDRLFIEFNKELQNVKLLR